MELYPDQLRRIADLCEGLDKIDGVYSPETAGVVLGFKNGIPIVDIEHGVVYGFVRNMVDGSWAFLPSTS